MTESAFRLSRWRQAVGAIQGVSPNPALGGFFWVRDRFSAERERWALWLPVILGVGIGLYFTLPLEPPWWAGSLALIAAGAVFLAVRKALAWNTLNLVLMCLLLGFSIAQWRTLSLAAPILERAMGPIEVRGRVLSVEPRSRGERLVLERLEIDRLGSNETPARIRITLASGAEGLYPGDWVRGRAKLSPPPEPAAPGAYDFARAAYFQRLGAVGFAYGRFEKLPELVRDDAVTAAANERRSQGGLSRHWEIWWADLRHRLSERIVEALPGSSGAVAAALMTGERGRVPESQLEALRDAGLAHLLAISGLHIGLVTAGLFFAVRGALALVPGLVLNYPIKKWAALVALPGAFAYLMLVGATIPAQRAFLMTGLVLLAVLLDRRALSMRLVAWAAMVTLLLAPESLLSVSFQMSFAAVTVMIAAYEGQRGLFRQSGADFWSLRSLLGYMAAVAATSALATVATAPFAVFHFNHLALYGVFANVIAVPITAFWIMPFALLAFILMPFGLEALPLWMMGQGIDLVVATAQSVSSLPSAALTVPAMPVWGLVAATAGGLWFSIWRGRWRLLGAFPLVASAISVALWMPPDILITSDARLFAVRLEDGSMWRSSRRVNRFDAEIWFRRAGVKADSEQTTSVAGTPRCDSQGCIFTKGQTKVALAGTAGAVAEDCSQVELMISRVPIRIACDHPVVVIDRFDLWRNGAYAVWIQDEAIHISSVAATRGERPWVLVRGRLSRER